MVMTVKTGNRFIPRTTTIRIEIPTANLGYLITANSKIVCAGDWDNDEQLEIAILPQIKLKIKYLYFWNYDS